MYGLLRVRFGSEDMFTLGVHSFSFFVPDELLCVVICTLQFTVQVVNAPRIAFITLWCKECFILLMVWHHYYFLLPVVQLSNKKDRGWQCYKYLEGLCCQLWIGRELCMTLHLKDLNTHRLMITKYNDTNSYIYKIQNTFDPNSLDINQ